MRGDAALVLVSAVTLLLAVAVVAAGAGAWDSTRLVAGGSVVIGFTSFNMAIGILHACDASFCFLRRVVFMPNMYDVAPCRLTHLIQLIVIVTQEWLPKG